MNLDEKIDGIINDIGIFIGQREARVEIKKVALEEILNMEGCGIYKRKIKKLLGTR